MTQTMRLFMLIIVIVNHAQMLRNTLFMLSFVLCNLVGHSPDRVSPALSYKRQTFCNKATDIWLVLYLAHALECLSYLTANH